MVKEIKNTSSHTQEDYIEMEKAIFDIIKRQNKNE